MAYCESCGREIPQGERLCERCARRRSRVGRAGRRSSPRRGEPSRTEPAEPEPAEEKPSGPPKPPKKEPGPRAPGRTAVAVMSGCWDCSWCFWGGMVFGSRGSGRRHSSPNPGVLAGVGDEPAAADPGPDTVAVSAPDAQTVLENTPPVHTYQIVVEDVSWQEAYDRAQAAGGTWPPSPPRRSSTPSAPRPTRPR